MSQFGGDPVDILRRLSLRTKAIVISNEHTHGQLQPADLRAVLDVLAADADERDKIVAAVEEDLRAARYPVEDVARLIGALMSDDPVIPALQRPAENPPPTAARDPNVLVTRKVRSPSMLPFGSLEFTASPAPEAEAPGADATRGPARAPGTDTAAVTGRGRMKFTAGGETASFTPGGFKGLAGMRGSTAASTRPSVLVADDDSRTRMMYRAKLEDDGYHVTEAKDGIEAWNYIRNGSVQCAVMDMKMPGYHGLEILGRMVDSNLLMPVVIVSAFDQLANEFVVSTYPKLTFLTKPAAPEQVSAAVGKYLRAAK